MAEVAIEKRFEIEVRDLEYQRTDGVPLLARLYRPIRPGNSGGSFPAVIEVHGGAWASGDRLNNAPIDEALTMSGIVVLAIDFRMPPQHRLPASIADVNLATRWLKNHAEEFGSRRELVGGLGTSSGAHQLLLSVLKPSDPRYAALRLAGAPAEDASLPYIVLCWPISDPLARYRMVREKGNTRLVESHDAYWNSEAEMGEGNPQLILDRGELRFFATAFGGPPGRRLQGLHRCHTGLHEAFELAGIGRVTVAAGIGAGDDLYPDLERPTDARHMRFLQRLRALANMRLRRSAVVLVNEQRRHKKDAALRHALEMARVLGEITAVLDRIDAGLDRNVEASPAECMAHDAAVERMRLVDERLHLVEIEGAVARPVPLTRAGTAGRGAFD